MSIISFSFIKIKSLKYEGGLRLNNIFALYGQL